MIRSDWSVDQIQSAHIIHQDIRLAARLRLHRPVACIRSIQIHRYHLDYQTHQMDRLVSSNRAVFSSSSSSLLSMSRLIKSIRIDAQLKGNSHTLVPIGAVRLLFYFCLIFQKRINSVQFPGLISPGVSVPIPVAIPVQTTDMTSSAYWSRLQ